MAIAHDGRMPVPDRHLVVTSRLRDRRHSLSLTQKQVVTRLAALGLTCTNKSLSSLEHGTGVDVSKLPELAAALDCTVTYLLGLTDDASSWQPDHPLTWRRRAGNRAAVPNHQESQPASTLGSGDTDDQHGWILGPYVPDRGRRNRMISPDA
jgi:transcriptional regulator with XRE-family HTH domain